ncbi:DUF2306 domain-containing protein [Tessaracoccus sp. OS52]|uniref:DUF2306 domain-containing protein n=1 Tax=Tessaracoccus sp. OS52 TaxID=2886691 RepID=UPI001D0F8994|nr:DUF2306 domain-containing protein [Tessaracoccus sp. OS52]MCC2594406.1 DUF2306 domain-containing protein [Tessaracoccus sp. OS52]
MTRYSLATARPARQRPPGGRGSAWRVPVALAVLVMIPLIAGSLRVLELAGGERLLPDNARIAASPAPLVVHVVGAAVFALAGAFQFPARIRRGHPAWHRGAGRLLVAAGLAVAGSGLWMTLFYHDAPGGLLLWTVRIAVAVAMASSLVLGVAAIRRGDVLAHRAWMIRAYALAVAAGTQAFTQGLGEGLFGKSDLSTALSVSAGWLINAAVAEWVIRRPGVRRTERSATVMTVS